jgi:uncharacterized membrane protein required for colicin V production
MVLIVFAVLAAIGQAINVAICLVIDKIFSQTVGALSFVVLYMLVFAGVWYLSVWVVEHWMPTRAAARSDSPSGHQWQHAAR